MWEKKKKKKKNKISDVELHKLREYIVTGIGIVVIGLIIDIDFALIFLAMYLATPVLSIGTVLIAVRKLEVTIQNEKSVLQKEEESKVYVLVTNDSLLPLLGLEIRFREDYHLKYQEKKRYTLSLGGKGSLSFRRDFQAVMWGLAELKMECALVTDMFGFVSFSLDMQSEAPSKKLIKIVPQIPKMLIENGIIEEWLGTAEDSDDRGESPVHTQQRSTVLGYEYKEYQPGDSLKRINWKLSEKKGVHMVRLEETEAYSPPCIVLDSYVDESAWRQGAHKEIMRGKQRIVEGLLGTVHEFIMSGTGCELYHSMNGEVEQAQLNTLEDLGELQWKLALFQFEEHVERLQDMSEVLKRAKGTVVIFTTGINERLCSLIDEVSHQGTDSVVVAAEKNSLSMPSMFQITETFELQKIT